MYLKQYIFFKNLCDKNESLTRVSFRKVKRETLKYFLKRRGTHPLQFKHCIRVNAIEFLKFGNHAIVRELYTLIVF